MQQTITNSVNISVLDSKIIADLCAGNFLIDLTPSVWIGSGATAVLGAKVKITNPFDVDVKNFPLSGYDIVSPMTSVVSFPIPTQAGNFQYGLYKFTVELTDANGSKYTITDNLTICEPNPEDKTKKYGNIIARIVANCKQSMVTIMLDEPPVYKAKQYESKTQSYILTYPTGSGLPPHTSTANAFSVSIFPGEYIVKGDVCVTYNFGDNNYIKVPYKINCKKNVQCIVDLCCVFEKIHFLNKHLGSCHDDEVKSITDTILDSLRLIKTIELGTECGEDISDYISELENLLQCKCSCSASANTPITNALPASNVVIAGCNVATSVNGLTTSYTIDNFEYLIAVNPASNTILAVSNSTQNACVKTQVLTFNIAGAYAGIKTLINNSAEYNYWAGIINNTLNTIPANLLLCLGYTNATWNALSFREKFLAALAKFCGCCEGSHCDALIQENTATSSGQTTVLSWVINPLSGTFATDIFVDNNFVDTVLAPVSSYALVGYNDGSPHAYKVIAKCKNGAQGNTLTGTFSNAGCLTILAPSLSSSSVFNAACPFNLTGLVPAAQAGYSIQWHNANNLLPSTLVADPTSVTSGTYYAFMVEGLTKCSSPSSQVIIDCLFFGGCSEPLGLLVTRAVQQANGTNTIITFSSAATPPPSYLVKRRLASNPEVSGSYTNIGAPSFNLSSNQWEISDTTVANTLYVYKAESQCADGSRPYSLFRYARIVCPTLTIGSIGG